MSMKLGFWNLRYAEYYFAAFISSLLGGFIVLATVLLRGYGLSPLWAVIFGGFAMILLPNAFVGRLVERLEDIAPVFSRDHPSKFLMKVGGLRVYGLVLEIIIVTLVSSGLELVKIAKISGIGLFYITVLEFSAIEFVLLIVRVALWNPDPSLMVNACLRSEFDPENPARVSWVDSSLGYFNSVLKSEHLPVRMRDDLSIEVLLYGSSTRKASVEMLRSSFEEGGTSRFIQELSFLANKPIPDILDKAGLFRWLQKNGALAVGIAALLVSLSGVFIFLFDYILHQWLNLIATVH